LKIDETFVILMQSSMWWSVWWCTCVCVCCRTLTMSAVMTTTRLMMTLMTLWWANCHDTMVRRLFTRMITEVTFSPVHLVVSLVPCGLRGYSVLHHGSFVECGSKNLDPYTTFWQGFIRCQ